jgi:hypothetical protein
MAGSASVPRPHRGLHEHLQAVKQVLLGDILYGDWGWPHSRSPAHFAPEGLVPEEWQRHCGASRRQARSSCPCFFTNMHISIHTAGSDPSLPHKTAQVWAVKGISDCSEEPRNLADCAEQALPAKGQDVFCCMHVVREGQRRHLRRHGAPLRRIAGRANHVARSARAARTHPPAPPRPLLCPACPNLAKTKTSFKEQ